MSKPVEDEKSKLKRMKEELQKKEWWKFQEKKDLTPEEKNDLIAIKLRNFIDSKSFYKSTDFKNLPKYFATATVIDGGDTFRS
jgi:hypothetical protein